MLYQPIILFMHRAEQMYFNYIGRQILSNSEFYVHIKQKKILFNQNQQYQRVLFSK